MELKKLNKKELKVFSNEALIELIIQLQKLINLYEKKEINFKQQIEVYKQMEFVRGNTE